MQRKIAVGAMILISVASYTACTSQRTVAIGRTTPGGWIAAQLNRCGDCGYEVREFRLGDGVDFRLWSGCEMAITVALPRSSLMELRNHRWVGGHSAVYFDVRLKEQQDSIHVQDNAKILFDFEYGQLYVTSPLHLWRGWDRQESWLTDDDFRTVLKSIERGGDKGI